jgi:cytosine/adenosine deaminase-related metal-dependent hydrolase
LKGRWGLKARFIVPVEGAVVEGGTLFVSDGRIASVERSGVALPYVIDYGDVVILPALVNAHTHLELGALAGRFPPSWGFVDWLGQLTDRLRSTPPTRADTEKAVRCGIEESLAAGVATVGDVTRFPAWSRAVLADSPIRAVSFGEIIAIGSTRDRVHESLIAAASRPAGADWQRKAERSATPVTTPCLLSAFPSLVSDPDAKLFLGISPHSPYTVEPEAMLACARKSRELEAPLCIHLLETQYEDDFTRHGRGPLADHLRRVGVWDDRIPVSGCGPVELLESRGLLGPRTLLVHVNYATDADIARIAASGAHVVYCPRTHAAFGHPPHRFRDMLAAGINVCIGTDSLASNPSLSVLDELRWLRRQIPDLPSHELIAMGTLRAARALGFERHTGSLTPGKSADLAVIPLESRPGHARWDWILESSLPPQALFIRGIRVGPPADNSRPN